MHLGGQDLIWEAVVEILKKAIVTLLKGNLPKLKFSKKLMTKTKGKITKNKIIRNSFTSKTLNAKMHGFYSVNRIS